MTATNLILQGLNPDPATIAGIAALVSLGATPSDPVALNRHAWRLEDVQLTEQGKAALEAACLTAQLDYALVE